MNYAAGVDGTKYVGVAIAIGAGVGAALFAATGSVVWIGAFIAIGAAVGAALSQAGQEESGEEPNDEADSA